MSNDYCYRDFCFVTLDADAPKFFGFSEFLTALALMVLAWTIADVRYRFRVRTAPVPLQTSTFAIVATVGTLILLTDLWRAERWLVPRSNLLTLSQWQALLGGAFLLTFLTWAWFATIRPAAYGKRNAWRYAAALYGVILRGSPSELSVIADELARSVRSLIRHAPERRRRLLPGEEPPKKPAKVAAYANDILLLIADKRFCRAIVETSPGTALAIFQEVAETRKYRVSVDIFARNLVHEAIANRDSFLFHEAEGYDSGLIGYHKPLTQAMFSNYTMVEEIGTLLDPDFLAATRWDASQWKAYCRVVLMTLRDYVERETHQHSFVLYRAKGNIEHAAYDLYKLNRSNTAWDADLLATLQVVVGFLKDAIAILEERSVPEYIERRARKERPVGTIYDHLATMIFETIFLASAVRAPSDLCWMVQHNYVWGEIFNFSHRQGGAAASLIKFKVRRLLYDEVVRLNEFSNFKGAGILGFCLNVMGLTVSSQDYYEDSKALQKAILSWTKKHYARLHADSPGVAEACLAGRITYDGEHRRLVKTYADERSRKQREVEYLVVDAPPAGQAGPTSAGPDTG